MALNQVASLEDAATLFAEGLAEQSEEEQQPDSDDSGITASPVQAAPEEESPQDSKPDVAAPSLLAEHEQEREKLERARRQEQSRADIAAREAEVVRTYALTTERELASTAAERDALRKILDAEGVTLSAEQQRMIQLEAANAANTHQSKAPAAPRTAPPPTKEEQDALREQDRQTLIGIAREQGVDLSKVNDLGLDLITRGDTPAFLRHFGSLLTSPYKKAMANRTVPTQTPAQQRIAANRVPRQNGSGGAADWRNTPVEEIDPYELIKSGLDDASRRR